MPNSKDNVFLKAAWKAIDEKFGTDTIMLDITKISPMSDYFVITTGSNTNQVRAIAEACEQELVKVGLELNHSEGKDSLNWVLLDFGIIIIHIFDKENREFYNLERIWGDATAIDLAQLN